LQYQGETIRETKIGVKGGAGILKTNNAPSKNGYPAQPVVAVGAIVFKNSRVLLVRRAQAPSRDLWAIPGGRVKIGETLQEAAEREILEETGITIQAREPVYTFDYIERDGSELPRFHYVIIDMIADYVRGEIRAGDDAADARWVCAEELAGLKVSSKTVRLLKTRFDFGI
jgi:ADP-ribose pyrophosphatase